MKNYLSLLSFLFLLEVAHAIPCSVDNTTLEDLRVYNREGALITTLGLGKRVTLSKNDFPVTVKTDEEGQETFDIGCWSVWTNIFHSPWVLVYRQWCTPSDVEGACIPATKHVIVDIPNKQVLYKEYYESMRSREKSNSFTPLENRSKE